jgi:hypothetical protein
MSIDPRPCVVLRCASTAAVSTRSSIAMVRLLPADSDVVRRIARGIVGIARGIIRAEVRLSGGIDRLIGLAAGERERHKSQKDRDPHFAYLEFNDRRRRRPSRPAFSDRRRVRCCSARS